MPLAPGTALQNGHYVIDALIETAPNGDLYYGTHVAVGLPVFIQVFPLAETRRQTDLSDLIARLEGVAFSPQSPLPSPFQLFRGDDHTLCLAMGKATGLPWSLARRKGVPMSPKQALDSIRQVACSVAWLKEQGIAGLDLLPNYIWLSAGHEKITLTGLLYAHLIRPNGTDSTADMSVHSLAKLLFSFLTSELIRPEDASSDAIRAQLKQHRPGLSPVIAEAIALGMRSPETEASLTLEQWLAQLPDAGKAYQIQPPSHQLTRQPAVVPAAKAGSSRIKPLTALLGTALMAAIGGGALGTFWRLNAQSLPGAIQLDPKQSFPDQVDWSGDTPSETFDSPFVPASNAPNRRDDWYDATPPEAPEAPSEGVPEAPIEAINDFELAPEAEFDPQESPLNDSGPSPAESPGVPVDALPDGLPDAPAPAPSLPPEVPQAPAEVPLDPETVNFSNLDETLLQPTLETKPKALPTTREATSEI
ncbi:MAG: hypothetical protein AAF722_16170 [Cyanobacteria bacterium P01_C01_bin.70]